MAMSKKELKEILANYRFKYVAVSDNAKTGKMSAVYTATCKSKTGSCPARCPFQDMCYAKNGPCNIHWEKTVYSETNISNLNETIKNGKKHKNILRHNVASDMAIPETSDLNAELVQELSNIYNDNFDTAYTYTHCSVDNQKNIEIAKAAAKKNFVINFSTETISDCKKCLAAGVNCVIAVNGMQEKVKTVDGVKVVKCPNADNKDIKCLNCGLCYQKNRAFAIAFPVHGAKKEKAKKSGFLTDL
jgi:hypothetical protein